MPDVAPTLPENDLPLATRGAERAVATLAAHRASLDSRPSWAKLTDERVNEGRLALQRAHEAAEEVLAKLKLAR